MQATRRKAGSTDRAARVAAIPEVFAAPCGEAVRAWIRWRSFSPKPLDGPGAMLDAIQVMCDECGNDFKVKPKAAGRVVKCPRCESDVQVEAIRNAGLATDPLSASVDDRPAPLASDRMELKRRTTPFFARQYKALSALRICLYILAAIVLLGWLLFTGFAALATSAAAGAGGPEWPENVPAGANMFDEGLTPEQIQALAEYNSEQISSSAVRGGFMGLGIMSWAAATVSAWTWIIMLCAIAEIARLLIDVQENTQKTAHFASQ